MTDEKRPPAQERGGRYVMPNESLYYMKSALIWHYRAMYPEQEALVTEICEMVGRLLGAREPHGGGGVGMIQGWEEVILEIEANSCTPSRTA